MTDVREPLTADAIVHDAVELIRAGGVDALSMRALASRMGVTAPAFYAHFGSRRELLAACAQYGYDELGDRFMAAETGSAVEQAREASFIYVRFALDEPELFQLVFMFRPDAIELDVNNEHDGASTVFDRMIANLAQAIDDGDLAPAEPLDYGLALWAAVHGVATVVSLAPGLDADALVARVVDSMLAGWSGCGERA